MSVSHISDYRKETPTSPSEMCVGGVYHNIPTMTRLVNFGFYFMVAGPQGSIDELPILETTP